MASSKLTGRQIEEPGNACATDDSDDFGISEFEIADKHGLPHRVYNAKINIHRRNGEPIYLGLREEDLPPDAPRTTADTDFTPLQG